MHAATQLQTPSFSAAEQDALKTFFAFYERHAPKVDDAVLDVAKRVPLFAENHRVAQPQDIEADRVASMTRLRGALVAGDWAPFVEDMRKQASGYAHMGVSFALWFELVAAMRKAMVPLILGGMSEDPKRVEAALTGLNMYMDTAMALMGDSYLAAKETIIAQQQIAIRELSTPVLQVQDELLIVPIVGVVDTHRARQLTEDLLRAIRARRAKLVIIDITGVPIVDSKVANHLVQTVEAAELMGATAIITGISPEIALTLVTLGAELKGVRTLGELQDGVAEANRLLSARGSFAHDHANRVSR